MTDTRGVGLTGIGKRHNYAVRIFLENTLSDMTDSIVKLFIIIIGLAQLSGMSHSHCAPEATAV